MLDMRHTFEPLAVEVMGDWLPNIGDTRTVADLLVEMGERAYVLGFAAGVNS